MGVAKLCEILNTKGFNLGHLTLKIAKLCYKLPLHGSHHLSPATLLSLGALVPNSRDRHEKQ